MRQAPPITALILLLGTATVYWLYQQALPGYWLFDDLPNLQDLEHVSNLSSAMNFILSGNAGELGRPVSLATFALQATAWDTQPGAMLRVNFIIHALSMFVAFFFATGLAKQRLGAHSQRAWWIGLFTALLWGSAPFLATTHLMVIQRMTSLSGLFVLAGLAAFVWAHIIYHQHRLRAQALLVLGLGGGTLLATLSKESGALLPLLALVIHYLWVPKEQRMTDRWSKGVFLALAALPALLLLIYLGDRFIDILLRGAYGAHRYFTPYERLLIQPVILLDYIRHLLLPRAIAVSPFMDNIPANSDYRLLALMLWVAIISVAVAVRRHSKLPLFAVAFFLAAHLLESTLIGLELYFAHRNYIPSIALFFAIGYFALTASQAYRKVATGLFGVYLLLNLAVLFQVTSNWTDRATNAKVWAQHNPHSIRAVQMLVNHHLDNNNPHLARSLIEEALERHPDHAQLHIQRTAICRGHEHSYNNDLQEALNVLTESKRLVPSAAISLIRHAKDIQYHSPHCPARSESDLATLAQALLDNPIYYRQAGVRSVLYLTKAFVHAELGHDSTAVEYFIKSYDAAANLDVALLGMSFMSNTDRYPAAYEFFDKVMETLPDNVIKRMFWERELDSFYHILRASEQIDAQQRGAE